MALVEFAFVALLLFSLVFGIAQRIVANRLSPALQRIDAILTGPLAQVLGINVGGADLTARARTCDGVALVG